MKIPKNINKEHLLKAIEKIDREGIPKDGESQYYDVFYNGKYYPPKLVVSYANIFANGLELDRNSFRGGQNTPCFVLLEGSGFVINQKQLNNSKGYYNELTRFITQAKEGGLATTNYLREYQGLNVKVSFGQGNQARIPWIAYLSKIDSVPNGIYPVYLFYKEKNLLILAYGVSETHMPVRNWNVTSGKTIAQYFIDKNLGIPQRYGSSYVFKVYNLDQDLIESVVENDLQDLIKIYKSTLNNTMNTNPNQEKFSISDFIKYCKESNLVYNNNLLKRFIASIFTKPFVILTGLSGSGKTKLAQTFVQWICQDESQYRIIPVGADWTNREPLLGYPNALKPEEYVKPDSGVLDLIIQANHQPDLPHFLILDEMNLSHVERYFADFLSVMESKEEIPLHSGEIENGVPAKLKVPSNLFIIGTVNIDETTNMFSPKVLDRANTIEFRVTQDEIQNFLGNIKEVNMDALTVKGAGMAKNFLDMAANKDFATDGDINAALVQFFGELKKTGAEFGYRSATEILRLIHQLTVLDPSFTKEQKIDIAIMQKLLPKLHGSRRKLCPVLEKLGSFCITEDVKIVKDVFEKSDFDFKSANVRYPLSLEKVARMYRGAIDNGFASFAEA
jgi:5-methylcytosine-specific restriction protein B